MAIILDGTAGIANNATDLSYTGTLTGSTGVVNIGSGQVYKDASGNVGIGASSPSFKIQAQGSTPAYFGMDATSGTQVGYANTLPSNSVSCFVGSIQTSVSATSYVTSSDYRLKNTIAPMTGALDKVALLKPVTYKWNVDGSDGQGFIAHELAEVEPGCVTGEKDAVDAEGKPKYQGIDTSFLVATLTAAIQEQQALIQSLTTRITALEAK